MSSALVLWQVVLVVLAPLFCFALAMAVAGWFRHRRYVAKRRAERDQLSTMLDDLQSTTGRVGAMAKDLEAGLTRVRGLESEIQAREVNRDQLHSSWYGSQRGNYSLAPPPGSWPDAPPPPSPSPAGSRVLSDTHSSANNTLPPAGPGLEKLPHVRSTATTTSETSSTAEESCSGYYARPSTIPEESSGHQAYSPPNNDDGYYLPTNGFPSSRDGLLPKRPVNAVVPAPVPQAQPKSSSSHPGAPRFANHLSPLRSNPSHPDLVPPPLAVAKRNSVRAASSPLGTGLSQGLDKKMMRRSLTTSAAATRSRGSFRPLGDSTLSSVFDDNKEDAGASASTSAGITAPPTAVSFIRERLEQGSSNAAKRNSTSSLQSFASHASQRSADLLAKQQRKPKATALKPADPNRSLLPQPRKRLSTSSVLFSEPGPAPDYSLPKLPLPAATISDGKENLRAAHNDRRQNEHMNDVTPTPSPQRHQSQRTRIPVPTSATRPFTPLKTQQAHLAAAAQAEAKLREMAAAGLPGCTDYRAPIVQRFDQNNKGRGHRGGGLSFDNSTTSTKGANNACIGSSSSTQGLPRVATSGTLNSVSEYGRGDDDDEWQEFSPASKRRTGGRGGGGRFGSSGRILSDLSSVLRFTMDRDSGRF